jgi:hypothetical protein
VIKEELLSHCFTGAEPSSVLGRGGAVISPLARGTKGSQPFYCLAILGQRRGPLIDPRGRSLKREMFWEREDPRQSCKREVALVNLEEGRDLLQSSRNEE